MEPETARPAVGAGVKTSYVNWPYKTILPGEAGTQLCLDGLYGRGRLSKL